MDIQDENAGAGRVPVPTLKYAQRAAEIATNHSNGALNRLADINKVVSPLASALSRFEKGERASEAESRYQQAFINKGQETGLNEFERDNKRTGFTKFIYGNQQSPEYLGTLNAAALNAASSFYTNEAEFIESGGGADMPPATYTSNLTAKLKEFVTEQFGDAPDAAIAFMTNWQDKSNSLTKQQIKANRVRELQKAQSLTRDVFQTGLSEFKMLSRVDPEQAEKYGAMLFSGGLFPKDVSPEVVDKVLFEEAVQAVKTDDYTAFSLYTKYGKPMDAKRKEEWRKAVSVLDTGNSNLLQAAKNRFDAATSNLDEGNYVDHTKFTAALRELETAKQQVEARNTNTTIHWENVLGTDKFMGENRKVWLAAVDKERKDNIKIATTFKEAQFNAMLVDIPDVHKPSYIQERIDYLREQSVSDKLEPDVATSMMKELVSLDNRLNAIKSSNESKASKLSVQQLDVTQGDRLNTYREFPSNKKKDFINNTIDTLINESALTEDLTIREKINSNLQVWYKELDKFVSNEDLEKRKNDAKAEKLRKEEAELAANVDYFSKTGNYPVVDKNEQLAILDKTIESSVNKLDPSEGTLIQKLGGILSDVDKTASFLQSTRNINSRISDSKTIKIVVDNLANSLSLVDSSQTSYTPEQVNTANALHNLIGKSPSIVYDSLDDSKQSDLLFRSYYISQGKSPKSVENRLDQINSSTSKPIPLTSKELQRLGLGDKALGYFKTFYDKVGSVDKQLATQMAKQYAESQVARVYSTNVLNHTEFNNHVLDPKLKGAKLQDVLKDLGSTYIKLASQNKLTAKSGLVQILSYLEGNEKSNSEKIYSLEGLTGVQIEVIGSVLWFSKEGRRQQLPIAAFENEYHDAKRQLRAK